MTMQWRCTGSWAFSSFWFSPVSTDVADQGPGPFAVVVDRPDTVTAWDIEAYDLGQTEQDPRNASPRPATP
jgi:hypothetical protein